MDDWKDRFEWLAIGDWAESGIRGFVSTFGFLLNLLRDLLLNTYTTLTSALNLPPWWLVTLVGALLIWLAAEQRRSAIDQLQDGQSVEADPDAATGPGDQPSRSGWRGWRVQQPQPWLFGLGAAGVLLLVDIGWWAAARLGDIALIETYQGPYPLFDLYRPSFLLLALPPSWVMVLMLGVLAGLVRSWLFGVGSAIALLLIDLMGQWANAMQTLAMIIVAVAVATVLAIPIGIAAARSRAVSSVVKPVLDFMQTMPALIYVLIAVFMFRVGVVPGIVATIIFAMPPGIRLTELGIRQVDAEVVEAGQAFGSSPAKILRQIQVPLALPTIMAGINQVIMLSLSMVVLAGFVGAPGLGQQVITAISRTNLSLGVEAGLSVVILAIYLDRVTAAFGARSTAARLERAA